MFWTLIIAATVAYGLQGALVVPFYRKLDALVAFTLRGLSFGITLLPLLFFADFSRGDLGAALPLLLVSGLTNVFGGWSAAQAYKYLATGIAMTIFLVTSVVVVGLFGFFFFHEVLSSTEIIFITLLLLANFALAFSGKPGEHYSDRPQRGVFFATLAGILNAVGVCIVSVSARNIDPFISGFTWEVSTGLFGLAVILFRRRFFGSNLPIHRADYFGMLKAAAPTLVGTGCYVTALATGPIGLATGILFGGNAVATALFAHWIFKEKLSPRQWALICAIAALLLLFKILH